MNRIRLAISERCRHARLFRNHCGVLQDPKTKQHIRFGLGPGSPDLVGWRVINGVAQFVGLEVKVPGGKLRDDQAVWLDAIEQAGGLAYVATSVEEACAILDTSSLTP